MVWSKGDNQEMIPIFRPEVSDPGIEALVEVCQSHWLGMGPKVHEFEKEFAKYIGTKRCVALNSCTAALDLALRTLDLKETDEVIVPVMTFVSTAHAVLYNRAKVVFADVDPITLNIDLDNLPITENTKAIIPVHYSGRPVDMDRLREKVGDITIIEDAAHASGSVYKGRKCGAIGDMGCFSFHAVKPLAIGDGGALTLNDNQKADRVKRLSWLGIDKSTWTRSDHGHEYSWEYFCEEIGFKYHMNDLQAALAIEQLNILDIGIAIRAFLAREYCLNLKNVEEIELPVMDDDDYKSSWHIFCIKTNERDELGEYLLKNGISFGVHYKPLHMFRCYKQDIRLPNSEEAFKRIMTLPLYTSLTYKGVESITDTIKEFYAEQKCAVTVDSGR